MALIRRDPERSQQVQPFGRDLFEWPFRPFEAWRNLFDEEHLNIDEFTENGELVVRAERRHEEKEERRNYRRTEIRYGSFTRTLPLPAGTKDDEIKASYKDGILEVRAPVQDPQAGRSKVPIQRS